jgi:hypothetical protein
VSYGDNSAKYLLASDANSRPESLKKSKAIAEHWRVGIKLQTKAALGNMTGYAEATTGLNAQLDELLSAEFEWPQVAINGADTAAARILRAT